MIDIWKSLLQKLRGRWRSNGEPAGPAASGKALQNSPVIQQTTDSSEPDETQVADTGQANTTGPPTPLRINLGIDFGTSYTKVCFRDLGESKSGIARLRGEAIVRSEVRVDVDGGLFMSYDDGKCPTADVKRYLKMGLAGLSVETGCRDQLTCKALAAWFLANVVKESQRTLRAAEHDRFVNRIEMWSANVGVPVEHFDSPAIDVFRRVMAVAWCWSQQEMLPSSLEDVTAAYSVDESRVDVSASDFDAVPEIAAAVQSFVTSREAREGLYLYFDIGGGTVDGVAFNFHRYDGERRLSFYSGKVQPLGMELRPVSDTAAETAFWKRLQLLVTSVVSGAKDKDRDNPDWHREAARGPGKRARFGPTPDHELEPLKIFLGGYGARDKTYREYIKATHRDFGQRNAGIPPYALKQVPIPKDLEGAAEIDFKRFVIAYGLSVPWGEAPPFLLPSGVSDDNFSRRRRPKGVDYLDSKDWT